MNRNRNLQKNINQTKTKNFSNLFYILFGNTIVNDGIELQLQTVLQEPTYRFDRMGLANKGKFHTLVMVDPDAPAHRQLCCQHGAGFWIHQCIYDIPADNIAYGKTFYEYMPPIPPPGTGKHRYFCILYEQKEQIGEKLEAGKRAFGRYGEFTKKLRVGLMPKASKFFICEYGKN